MAAEVRILELIANCLQGTASASEIEELKGLLDDATAHRLPAESQEALDAIVSDLILLTEIDKQSLNEKIWAGISAAGIVQPRRGKIKRIIYTGIGIAASVLLVVAGIHRFRNSSTTK